MPIKSARKYFTILLFVATCSSFVKAVPTDTLQKSTSEISNPSPLIEMAAIRAEKELHKMELQKERTYRNIYIAGTLALMGFIFFIYRNNRLNKKLNQKLGKEVKERTQALETIANQLMKSEKQLKETNKELESFIYRTSHDLKGPISSAKGLVNLALDSNNPNDVWEYLLLIRGSIDKLDAILVTLYEVSVIRKGEVTLKALPVMDLINSSIQNLSHEINYNKIKFSVVNNMTEPFISDALLTQTILRNMLQNTVKYSQLGISDPIVNIVITDDKFYQTITVEDNGIGIREEFKEKIFEPFVRANDTTKGSGLGLYIVTNALDKLGGRIELVRSEPYKGSVFKLYFPKSYAAY